MAAVDNERLLYKKLYKEYLENENILVKHNDLIKKVPLDNDLSTFIKDIEGWLQESNISLINIIPQEEKVEEISGTEVKVIPCEITISGTLDLLLSLMNKLENYSRICKINEIRLNEFLDDNFDNPSLWKLTINVGLYYMPEIE